MDFVENKRVSLTHDPQEICLSRVLRMTPVDAQSWSVLHTRRVDVPWVMDAVQGPFLAHSTIGLDRAEMRAEEMLLETASRVCFCRCTLFLVLVDEEGDAMLSVVSTIPPGPEQE